MSDKEKKVETSSFRKVHKVEVEKKPLELSKKTIGTIVLVIVLIAGGMTGYLIYSNNNGDKYTSKVTGGSKEVITGDVTITKQGYYEYLLDNYGSNQILTDAYNKIASKEITDTKKINEKVEELEKKYKTNYGSLKAYATAQGYSDVKELEEKVIIPSAKLDLMEAKYLDDNFKKITDKYYVSYLKVITYSKESQAVNAIKKASDSKAFNQLAKENSGTYKDYGLVSKVSSTTTIDANIIKKAETFSKITKNGIYKDAVKLSTGSYAIVYIYNTDKTSNKSSIIQSLGSNEDVKKDIEAYYLKKYKFTVYDKKLKKAIKELNKDFVD
ncbi:hypothetical protein [Eggerthia catenaformis]|uniref:hypothetical protein n=1 Tax=Eggerthia catenaformis TaxID=31973 RepID=UPI00248F0148|nr:hypothetical protein [Eggerthia catenaformis]